MSTKQLIPIGELLDDSLELSLDEMAQRCAVQTELIVEMVQVGVLEPREQAPAHWCFTGYDLLRLQRALRLQKDLEINLPGLALCVELLEELDALRARMRVLERRC